MTATYVKRALLTTAFLAVISKGSASDWPHFLGPNYDGHAELGEAAPTTTFPENGLPILWETPHGASHTAPTILGGALVFIHLLDGMETIQCHDAATGELRWKTAYPVRAGQSYGISDAPRCSPVIDPDTRRVYTMGFTGELHCFALETGDVIWKRNLSSVFGSSPFFFGRGASPLIWQDRLIINVGGPDSTVAALDKHSGESLWQTKHKNWQASYASPIPVAVEGKDYVLIFTGGMIDPPVGGL
ncbi:MAG: PQQ-binding-like beta-propeller repeat protein, partial [Verrucomicrobiota bacterium]